jgi:sugar phosphate isomerase/epimerase
MKRLVIIGTSLLALTLLSAPQAPAQEAGKPSINYAAMRKLGWRLSCQAWTFRELTAFDTIDTVHKLGIRYIEFFPGQKLSKEHPEAKLDENLSPELLNELLAKLKDANVKAVNYGVVGGLKNDEAGARKVFEFAKKLGLQTIVAEPTEDAFPMLDKLCNEYNINIAIHDHPKPSHYWNPDTVLKVSEGRSKRIGSCADTGHWYRSGLVPVECMRKLEGRIISFHLKDLTPEKRDTPWGEGACDIKGILTEAKRQGLRPVFSVEYESTSGDVLYHNVEKCRDYFSKIATEFAGQ